MAKYKITEEELTQIIKESIIRVNEGQGLDAYKALSKAGKGNEEEALADIDDEVIGDLKKWVKTGTVNTDEPQNYYETENPFNTFRNKTEIVKDKDNNTEHVVYKNMDSKPINKGFTTTT